ncbi:MAG: ribosomal L7Ae/L30e/S12e/Gadd45 family protein [Candidatus Woesearchaeota archaeon]|jgi:ribosomal protein L30E
MKQKIETMNENEDTLDSETFGEDEEITSKEEKDDKETKKIKKTSKKKSSEEDSNTKEKSENVAEDTQESTDEESLEDKIKKKKQKEKDQYDFEFTKEEKKIIVDNNIAEIKSLSNDQKIVGTKRVMNLLRQNKISKVFLTNNVPTDVVNEISHIANITKTEIVSLKNNNNELGVVCRKPFSISVLGVLK